MKKLLAFAIGAALSLSAVAGPATSLPGGPIYLKFNGNEQIAVNNAHTWGNTEINWGVFTLSTMEKGSVNTPHDSLDGTGDQFFNNGPHAQITGMFYGVERGTPSAGNPFPAVNGFIDLYWRDLDAGFTKTTNATNVGANSSLPGVRCGFSCATGYTEGTFLARLKFDTGMDVNNPNNAIVGTVVPTASGFPTGLADAYASVDTSAMGLWTEQLDTNWFQTLYGTLRDLRFKNSYNPNTAWNGAAGSDIIGARIDDPAQAVALPEPGALSLMGLTLAGMGAVLRRRQKKEKA
jgi:hypothetical protein